LAQLEYEEPKLHNGDNLRLNMQLSLKKEVINELVHDYTSNNSSHLTQQTYFSTTNSSKIATFYTKNSYTTLVTT